MIQYNYVIKNRVSKKIKSFYENVAKKYKHTFDKDDFIKNTKETIRSIYKIENTLLKREPTISKWKEYNMANTKKWYFAYKIEGNTIIIVDACHAQNMKENLQNEIKFISKPHPTNTQNKNRKPKL